MVQSDHLFPLLKYVWRASAEIVHLNTEKKLSSTEKVNENMVNVYPSALKQNQDNH